MTSKAASTSTEGRDLNSELHIRRDPPRPFLCLSGVIRRDNIPHVMNSLIERFALTAAGLTGLGPQVALYHPQGRDPFGADGEPCWLGRELSAPLDAPAGLLLNWTPGGAIATLVHHGAYERMLETHFALHRSVKSLGRKLIGPNWERYRSSNDPSELRTEVCYLLSEPTRSRVALKTHEEQDENCVLIGVSNDDTYKDIDRPGNKILAVDG